ncbi:MAG: tetratricopeptide repeat protein, partial [Rhodothermales bacterium]
TWDEPLSDTDQHILRAACAWMTRDWDSAAELITNAYPKGVKSMPSFLQEDWLRLALYRERPDDAAEAARNLIAGSTPERADILLQTLVQQGWHKEALALYRAVYNMKPESELLRRRMVGLCIREGELQEARRLMEQGALRLAV